MNLVKENNIGEIVANDYRTATVFKSFGVDFCCKGNRTISEVCAKKNISEETILKALDEVTQDAGTNSPNFTQWALDLLTDYIEKKHHRYVRKTVPPLNAFLEKLCRVHGQNHPELFEIRDLFAASAKELMMHMQKEEGVLFPIVREMVEVGIMNKKSFRPGHFGTVQMPINTLMHEHTTEGDRFREIAELSNNYTPPSDACSTYRVTFSLLQEFEEDLHAHIHLENNILFPKAVELEKELANA